MTIKEMRTACEMTQASFGEYLGIPRRTIQNWENGMSEAPIYVINLIEYKLNNEGKLGNQETNSESR